jgi:type IV pilus assembly protein PilW
MRKICHPRLNGFSLVELMIGLTVGLIVVAGLSTIYANSSRSQTELQKSAAQIENGRYAMEVISNDLHLAGFYGDFANLPPLQSSTMTVPAALPDPCTTSTANLLAALPLPLQGYDSPSATPISTCLTGANFLSGTDILVVRRASTAVLASTATPVTNEIYLQANTDSADIQAGSSGSTIGTTRKADGGTATIMKKNPATGNFDLAADIRKYEVHIYFVAPCSVPNGGGTTCTGGADDNGSPIPTLKRLELTSDGTTTVMNVVPLVEGIQNLQIEYGIDDSPNSADLATGFVGDGAPDSYITNPSAAALSTTVPATVSNWQNVVAAKVFILARNSNQTNGYTDSKTYCLGSLNSTGTCPTAVTFGPFNDPYKRHVYSAQVRLTNLSSRRETP